MHTSLLSYFQSKVWGGGLLLVLGGTFLKKCKFQSKYRVSLTQLKKTISIRKTHWLALSLRKAKFWWNQVSSLQQRILREKEKEKNLACIISFLLPLKREIEKLSDTCSLFPPLGDPLGLPACYPLILPISFRRIMLLRKRCAMFIS